VGGMGVGVGVGVGGTGVGVGVGGAGVGVGVGAGVGVAVGGCEGGGGGGGCSGRCTRSARAGWVGRRTPKVIAANNKVVLAVHKRNSLRMSVSSPERWSGWLKHSIIAGYLWNRQKPA